MKNRIRATRLCSMVLVALLALWASIGLAADPAAALTVVGADGAKRSWSLEDLRRLPAQEFTAIDPWEKAPHAYRGVLLTEVIKASGHALKPWIWVFASNGYKVGVSWKDAARMGHILAFDMDGLALADHPKGSNKAPLMVAIPFTADSDVEVYKHQLVWMVASLELKE